MCGIVALFSHRDPISDAVLRRATHSLHHRGPDGQGHWISSDRRVALGHTRLSIIDLTTGDQPIASEDGQTRIVVNGEFYGYEAIQRELEQSGHRLRTRSDSEIALHLYEDFGVQCLHRLRGEFAFVLWDQKNRTIFAARDRFGIKPLFYAWHDGDAVFRIGSESAVCRRRAGALGCRVRLSLRRDRRASDAHAVRWDFPDSARPLPDRQRQACAGQPVLGFSLSAAPTMPHLSVPMPTGRRSSVSRWKRRFAFACAPTFRSAVT